MKHLIVSLLAATIIAPVVYGQEDEIRSHEIGVSYNLYDYKTAEIKPTTTIKADIRNKQYGEEKTPPKDQHNYKGLKKQKEINAETNHCIRLFRRLHNRGSSLWRGGRRCQNWFGLLLADKEHIKISW